MGSMSLIPGFASTSFFGAALPKNGCSGLFYSRKSMLDWLPNTKRMRSPLFVWPSPVPCWPVELKANVPVAPSAQVKVPVPLRREAAYWKTPMQSRPSDTGALKL